MATQHQVKIYGAWLYRGKWDGHSNPPLEGWKLLKMTPGKFTEPPKGFSPGPGQVTLLGQGLTCILFTPGKEG